MSLATDAFAYKTALFWGAISLSEVINWADCLITAETNPNAQLFEISLAKDSHQAMEALGVLINEACPPGAMLKTLNLFALSLYNGNVNYQSIANALFQMAFKGYAPDAHSESEMFRFSDALSLAEDGIYGDPEEIKTEIRQFLNQYATKD